MDREDWERRAPVARWEEDYGESSSILAKLSSCRPRLHERLTQYEEDVRLTPH